MKSPVRFNNDISRREALKRVIGLSVALSAMDMGAFAQGNAKAALGRDPNLLIKEIPWLTILTAEEMRTVTVLADLILPADEHGPAASAVGVPEFINEWVSAPYEVQQADAAVIRTGLALLDDHANQRHQTRFSHITQADALAMLDDIVRPDGPLRASLHGFFVVFRDRAAGGYYSTPEGWKAIGYVGNVPMAEFPGPPPEVLQHLGLA